MSINSILVVCTGNICRSPFAEAALKTLLPAAQLSSAGTHALVGKQADAQARAVGNELGYDLVGHVAQQIVPDLVSANELILVMESGQRNWLHNIVPASRGKVFLLGHWENSEEVADPYRRGEQVFRRVFKQILHLCDSWQSRLE